MSLLKSPIFCLLLSVAVWTRTGRLQWGHRGRIVGLSDAKNRLVIGKNIMTTHPERPRPHIHNTCLAAADHDVSLSAGRLHKHSRWGSGSCRPTVTVPLRILTSGRQSTKHVTVRIVWRMYDPNPVFPLPLQAYHVTDAALGYFSPKQSHSLSILRLQSCWELTNHGIVNIGKSLIGGTLNCNALGQHIRLAERCINMGNRDGWDIHPWLVTSRMIL